MALAVYFNNEAGGNEAAFTQEMGGAKPSQADFNAIRDQASKFDPGFNARFPQSTGDLSWEYLFFLQAKLLEEQRTYIASCALDDDHDEDLLDDALKAVEAADAAEEPSVPVPVPGTYTGQGNGPDDDPECSAFRQAVRDAKKVVGQLGKCLPGMGLFQLTQRKDAWLNMAKSRSTYHKRCYAGGNETHQDEEAKAWAKVGECDGLLQ